MKKQQGFTLIQLVFVLLFIFNMFGYIFNIVKLTECDFEKPYKCEIVHGLGIFPAIGVFTGYMNLDSK